MEKWQFFISYAEGLSYLGLFLYVALLGHIALVPEEVILLLTGYLAAEQLFHLPLAIVVVILAVLAVDNCFYWCARRGNRWIDNMKGRLGEVRLAKYEALMKANVGKSLFLLRFAVGFRFIGSLLAGSLGVRWFTFQFYDLIAVAFYNTIFILIGYAFHESITIAIAKVTVARHILAIIVFALVGFVISYWMRKWLRFIRAKKKIKLIESER